MNIRDNTSAHLLAMNANYILRVTDSPVNAKLNTIMCKQMFPSARGPISLNTIPYSLAVEGNLSFE